jgi:hypothetical protein
VPTLHSLAVIISPSNSATPILRQSPVTDCTTIQIMEPSSSHAEHAHGLEHVWTIMATLNFQPQHYSLKAIEKLLQQNRDAITPTLSKLATAEAAHISFDHYRVSARVQPLVYMYSIIQRELKASHSTPLQTAMMLLVNIRQKMVELYINLPANLFSYSESCLSNAKVVKQMLDQKGLEPLNLFGCIVEYEVIALTSLIICNYHTGKHRFFDTMLAFHAGRQALSQWALVSQGRKNVLED